MNILKDKIQEFRWGNLYHQTQFFYYILAIIISGCTLWVASKGVNRVDDLTWRQYVRELADRCLWNRPDGGEYRSYEELEKIIQNERSIYSSFARTKVEELKISYLGAETLVALIPVYRDAGGGQLVEECKPICNWNNIIAHSDHSFWQSRAKAIYFLRRPDVDLPEQHIRDKLMEKIKFDSSLIVRTTALNTFRLRTKFEQDKPENIFHFKEAEEWYIKKAGHL